MSSFREALSAAFEPKREQLDDTLVQLSSTHEAVMVFTIPRADVPTELPIAFPATGGASAPPAAGTVVKFQRARVNRKSLIRQTSVRSINILPLGDDLVKVFVNLDADVRRGYNAWALYAPFIEGLIASAWGECRIRRLEKKTFVNFAGQRLEKRDTDTCINFKT